MNSSSGKKRKNIEDDRLSALPDDLIHKILSFVGIKHAVRTIVLSSRWRFIWTSLPYLKLSRDDFSDSSKVSNFVTHVLSGRNKQTEVSSVNLCFRGEHTDVFFKQIIEYAFSHNVQQLNVASLFKSDVEYLHFSSSSLKHLSLRKEIFSRDLRRSSFSYVIKAPSTWELPSLTTLYLHDFTFCCDGLTDKCVDIFDKCANLKNLTLKGCHTKGFEGLSICLPLLCSLTLENVYGSVEIFNIVAPQLKTLIIRSSYLPDNEYLITAPDLAFFLYRGYLCLQLYTDDFLFLEKADICVSRPRDAHQIVHLLQQLHSAKFLKLNLEIVELLSSSVELMSNQPSPFANLKSLNIYPNRELSAVQEHEIVKMSAEVKSYLLDGSPGATFTVVTREDARAMKNTKLAQMYIVKLRLLLEQEKASTETKMAQMPALLKPQVDKHIDGCIQRYIDMRWKCVSSQIDKGKEKASDIISKLKEIKELLEELPASNMAIIQPSFSALCAEADIVMNKLTDFMKMNCDENQRHLSACVHELATTLQPLS